MTTPDREELLEQYLSQLPYTPYPVQEEALLAWFTSDKGVLVCAPTGTGKTAIAQGALYEALHTGTIAYYTTPLIALTEQKFREMQETAVKWGFQPEDVGLVTGNRRVNPRARILIVVAEILLNRLLNPDGDESGGFDFSNVSAVVMDEFHSFADPQRGIVWELSLSMLPKHVRLLLLSATVGNSVEFLNWLDRCHGRKVELVESTERKVPLHYEWVHDKLLGERVVEMVQGDDETKRTPALVFCFNREECWNVAEQFKGLPLVTKEQKAQLHEEVNKLDWKQGVGPKIKQMLHRGVGVHHAGLLPKYKRVVEDLFERKLLSFIICTETLAAGINLPARSVVLTTLVKGPSGNQKLVDASIAKQIFGRAGRPQYDDKGYVIALAHEDDVRLHHWQLKYDSIPEDTKDPGLIKAKKQLKKKKPKKSDKITYWTEGQFQQLQEAKPARLYSKGPIPWRLLAYLLKLSPEISRIRNVIRKRLMDHSRVAAGEKILHNMLLTLHRAGYVVLEPPPPGQTNATEEGSIAQPQQSEATEPKDKTTKDDQAAKNQTAKSSEQKDAVSEGGLFATLRQSDSSGQSANEAVEGLFANLLPSDSKKESETANEEDSNTPNLPDKPPDQTDDTGVEGLFAALQKGQSSDQPDDVFEGGLFAAMRQNDPQKGPKPKTKDSPNAAKQPSKPTARQENSGNQPKQGKESSSQVEQDESASYRPEKAMPTDKMDILLAFRAIHPLYGAFLVEQLGDAEIEEKIQAFESVLEIAKTVIRFVRVPDDLPPGPLTLRLDEELIRRGLILEKHMASYVPDEDEQDNRWSQDPDEEWVRPPKFADKLKILFEAENPDVHDVNVLAVWAAGELLEFGGDFNKLITSKNLAKQEGIIFRHLLRLVLLLGEFMEVTPPGVDPIEWRTELQEVADRLTASCREVDPQSTEETIEHAQKPDVVEGKKAAETVGSEE
ncbi:MAG: DEAD/DEAH box helicase [Gemmataceae bacterium]